MSPSVDCCCFSPADERLRERQEDQGKAVWVAVLRDGRKVYQDDDETSWPRLIAAAPSLPPVVALGVFFRGRQVWPEFLRERKCYFFSLAAFAGFGGRATARYILGAGDCPGDIETQSWQVPALVLEDSQKSRKISLNDPRLLVNRDEKEELLV